MGYASSVALNDPEIFLGSGKVLAKINGSRITTQGGSVSGKVMTEAVMHNTHKQRFELNRD